jgi:hypothetical protein
MGVQSITTLPALAVTVGSAQLRGEIEIQSGLYLYNLGEGEDDWAIGIPGSSWCTYIKETDHLRILASPETDVTWVRSPKVDVSEYSTLWVEWISSSYLDCGRVYIGLSTEIDDYPWVWPVQLTVGTEDFMEDYQYPYLVRIDSLDISNATGEYFIAWGGNGSGGSNDSKVFRIWLE